MIGVGNTIWGGALGGTPLTELEQIQAAMRSGVVGGGVPSSTYAVGADGGAASTVAWEDTLDGGSPSGESVHYIVSPDGVTTYVRSALRDDRDVVQAMRLQPTGNGNVEFGTSYLIAPSAADSIAVYTSGTPIVAGGDDACPVRTLNAGYLGANHGLAVPVVTSLSHDKTADDLGSTWSDGTHQFVLAEVLDDELTFYSVPWTSGGTWYMATSVGVTLTHVAGATHAAAIGVTSQLVDQRYPVVKNLTTSILANGEDTLSGGDAGAASFVDFVEEFDLVDPSTLVTTHVPFQWNDGEVWLHVRHVYRCHGYATTIHTTYELLRPMNVGYFGYLQVAGLTSAAWAHQHYYIPKSLPIDGYDFAGIQLLDTAPASSVLFDADHVDDPDNPIDRAVVLLQLAGETGYDVGLAFGYSPYLDGLASARAYTTSCWTLAATKKTYPMGQAGIGVQTSGSWEVYAYRQWVDLAQFDAEKLAYSHQTNGRQLVYVDYQRQVSGDVVALPARCTGRTITTLDSHNCSTAQTTVPASGLVLTSSAARGWIVLELA